jgi:serine kinase of HPr protein (carbohydrate metabolism regulator)
MKKIIISGQEFMYQVCYKINELGEYEWTEFFQEFDYVYKKQFAFFGKVIKKEVPKILFAVNFNIEDQLYTQEEIKNKLEWRVKMLTNKKQ